MARKARLTKTPKWLSIVREIMIYLGGSTFLITSFHKLGIKDTEYATQTFMSLLMILQIYNRFSYTKEKEDRFPTEAKNLRE